MVYIESEVKKFETSFNNCNLNDAKNKASTLRINLNGENPILYIHPSANSYTSFSDVIKEPYVLRVELPPEIKTTIETSFSPPDNSLADTKNLLVNL